MVIEGNLQNIGGCRQNFEFRWRLRDEEGCKLRRKIKRMSSIKNIVFETTYEMSSKNIRYFSICRHFVGDFEGFFDG